MTAMQVTTRAAGTILTVVARGRVDLSGHDCLLRAILDAIATPGANEVIVDLADVTFMDSTGIGVACTYNSTM
ncbi:STAS domain-containing protein [Longispora urticae]